MEYLQYTEDHHIGILEFNRPEVLNALSFGLLNELDQFLSRDLPQKNIRVLILTGSGEKAFIAGADIKEMQKMNHMEMLRFLDLGQRVSKFLEEMDKITIAAVNGYALGGGLEMALGCDFIYATNSAKLGLPEVSLGLIPGFGGTQRLCRTVGNRMAKELVMTGRMIDAQEALRIGLVNRLVDTPDELMEAAKNTANEINKNAFSAVTQAKRAINSGSSMAQNEALEMEKQCCTVCFATDDRLEGMTAFLEKRPPQFA